MTPLFTNEAVVFGLLMSALALVFYTSSLETKFWQRFYSFFPKLLMCYFIPALFYWPLGWIDGANSKLYSIAKDYFLPASLISLCLSIDMKAIIGLGPRALIMFFAGAFGIVIGGPIALISCKYLMPEMIAEHGDNLWRGLTTIAGSWIGGSANQAALKEIYNVPQNLFGTMLIIDVVVANVWMAILIYLTGATGKIDKWLKADTSSIEALKLKSTEFRNTVNKNPSTQELVILFAIIFAGVGLSHLLTELIMPSLKAREAFLTDWKLTSMLSNFFWIVSIATAIGIGLSFTPAKKMEGIGASKFGTLFIYLLVATIGMQMNLKQVFNNGSLFLLGLIWIIVHVVVIIVVAKIIKAPFFFVAVSSQANIGGAASAPIVASAFDISLAPVGVLLAVLGNAVGTYGAIISAQLMSLI
jgi:uncharacterized membrane protein